MAHVYTEQCIPSFAGLQQTDVNASANVGAMSCMQFQSLYCLGTQGPDLLQIVFMLCTVAFASRPSLLIRIHIGQAMLRKSMGPPEAHR